MFADPVHAGKLYRPIPCLTFGLNWFLGRDNVTGYHIVNISIHVLAAFWLYLTILTLFQSPNLKGKYPGSEYWIALLATVLWALNPIQTQAVTYIVQRMASMAAMFYILGIFFYVKGRLANSRLNSKLFYVGCLYCFVFAVLSKENAVMLPGSLFLVEVLFFQDLGIQKTRKAVLWFAAGVGVMVVILGVLLFMRGQPLSFINGYQDRPFSLAQRLMTEPRILIIYLSQIFYPIPSRLSFDHPIALSTSLIEPWTTLPAILTVLLLICSGIFQIRKRPVLAFGILFFFLNHVIESSFIPLELVFEHRNYLPTLFLLFPVAAGLKRTIDYYRKQKSPMFFITSAFSVLFIIGLGGGTYIRNLAWATEKSLWQDVMEKAPNSGRAHQNLAAYYKSKGQLEYSLELYRKALTLTDQRPEQSRALSLNNMGNIYTRMHDYETAIKLYQKVLDVSPQNERTLYNLTSTYAASGKWTKASETVDLLLARLPNRWNYLNLKGFILLKLEKPAEALPYFRNALRGVPYDRNILVNIGMTHRLLEEYQQAESFFANANSLYPKDPLVLLCLAETYLKANKPDLAHKYLDKFMAELGDENLESYLKTQFESNTSLPMPCDLIIPAIVEKTGKSKENMPKCL
jgi:tetratricopeptide (TPR) repeat protein